MLLFPKWKSGAGRGERQDDGGERFQLNGFQGLALQGRKKNAKCVQKQHDFFIESAGREANSSLA